MTRQSDRQEMIGPQAHQRVDGEARIRFKRAGEQTVLADLFQRAPCRVLFPATSAADPPQAVLLTTSGGLTGGDRTRIAVDVGPHARATFTTQAAEKIYRALPGTGDALVQVSVQVGAEAWSEWLQQETILFEGSRLRRLFTADVDPEGRLLALETTVFGRTAMGERYDTGLLHDAWRIRRAGRLIWADALHLAGDVRRLRSAPFGFGTSVACSTVLYVGPDASRLLEAARGSLQASRFPSAAATAFAGLLLVRLMADDALRLKGAVIDLIGVLRHAAAGLTPRLPRVWHC
jgi:urease accessory protein